MLQLGNSLIEGNFIGTDVTGEVVIPSYPGAPALYANTDCTFLNNVISTDGIESRFSNRNVFQGNFFGTNKEGTLAIASGLSQQLVYTEAGFSGNTFGGTAPGAGNLFAGPRVAIYYGGGGAWAANDVIEGNTFGIPAPAGVYTLIAGVYIAESVQDVTIGGTTPGSGNTFANNETAVVLDGRAANPPAFGISILGNSMHDNGAEIDNEPNQTISGVGDNGLQAAPLITSAYAGATTAVNGTLSSTANDTFRVEFFASPGPDVLGHPEGQRVPRLRERHH